MGGIELAGRVAMVTGAASGVGRACAARLAAAGAAVALADADGAAALSAARDIGGDTLAVALDVARESAWPSAMAAVAARWQRLDIMVNAASAAEAAAHDVESFPTAEWRRVIGVNLEGTFLGCRHAVLAMKGRRRGSIVNIAAVQGDPGDGTSAAGCASRGGIVQLTRTVALHCGTLGYDIRCNAVVPGGVPHEGPACVTMPAMPATPDDVADLVLYLGGDGSAFATGAVFPVGGGFPAR